MKSPRKNESEVCISKNVTESYVEWGILAKVIFDQRLLPPEVENIQLFPLVVQQKTTWPPHRRSQLQFGEKTEVIINVKTFNTK